MHRLFVGIPIPPSILGEAVSWQMERERWPVRWVSERDLHVTLLPPWESEDPETDIRRFKAIETLPSRFDIRFSQISFGGVEYQPNLIWATGETPPPILDLCATLEQTMSKPSNRMNFKLHATLARFRAGDFSRLPDKKLNEDINWQGAVDRIYLYESHLSPRGAEYDVLAELTLHPI